MLLKPLIFDTYAKASLAMNTSTSRENYIVGKIPLIGVGSSVL